MNLVQRAAHYFGIGADEKGWTSIKTGRLECILVARASRNGRVIAYYSEEYQTRGHYIWLTEARRKALVEALDAVD